MGTASLALGLSGLGVSWTIYVSCLGLPAGILAVVFGFIGLGRVGDGRATNRRSTVAGVGTGLAAVVANTLFIAFAWSAVFGDDAEDGAESETGTEQGESDANTEQGEPGREDGEPAGLGEGVWAVGTEIDPGTYVTWVEDDDRDCSVARLAGFSGDFDDRIADASFDGRGRITIAEDDAGVEFSGGCEWLPATQTTLAEQDESVEAGIWEVGTEVRPGVYTTRVEGEGESCYVARLSGFGMEWEEIIASDYLFEDARGRIEVLEDDTGVEFSGACVWTLE